MNDWQKELKKWKNQNFIKALKKQLPKAEIFLVGGAVRDAILNQPTADFDFVVRKVGKAELQNFLQKQGKVDLVGRRFGVFKFIPKNWKGQPIDIALPRTEHSKNMLGIYKDFVIKSNAKLKIEDDLSRRDFTINAMAYDIFNGKLIDPFNGYADCKKKIIRAVGTPHIRFKEDYSRMLRAIRFACQLNFEIAQTAWQAIISNIKKLNTLAEKQRVVPEEVIAAELIKMFKANPLKALDLLDQSGALNVLMPELLKMKKCAQPKNFHSEGDVWVHTELIFKKISNTEFKKEFNNPEISNELIWGILFHDLGKPYTAIKTDRIRFNNHDNVSAEKFEQIANRLKLSAGSLDVDKVKTIIGKHMLAAHANLDQIKETTLEKYFFNDQFPGQELLMLIFADTAATIWENGKANFTDYKKLKKRIEALKKKSAGKKVLPKPIVNGNEIMKAFKLSPGKKIGQLLILAREQQLKNKIKTKAQALKYLKTQL